jgi:alpha-D-ribose 1-methylphosphonate 5-triphosphate synthase subunit PhnG
MLRCFTLRGEGATPSATCLDIWIGRVGQDRPSTLDRSRWLGVLAQAPRAALAEAWARLEPKPALEPLRQPELGLVMLRGRMGGTGARFNLGEMTVTRCAVRLADGTIGHGYVQGRDREKALLVARLDALLQTDGYRERLLAELIGPLMTAQSEVRAEAARKAAATRVEFFTLVRGDA